MHKCQTYSPRVYHRIYSHLHAHTLTRSIAHTRIKLHTNHIIRTGMIAAQFGKREQTVKIGKMASIIGSSFRCRRIFLNFAQLSRNYSSANNCNRSLKNSAKHWCLIGGGLLAFSYVNWKKLDTVHAFNPKKIKVSRPIHVYTYTHYTHRSIRAGGLHIVFGHML